MKLARITGWTFLITSGFALLSLTTANGQDLPQKGSDYTPAVRKLKDYRGIIRGGIPKEELPQAREYSKVFAKYWTDLIASETVWKASLDPKIDTRNPIPTIDSGPNGIFRELDLLLLEPVPGGNRVAFGAGKNSEPADYIRELGAALDAELKKLIETHPQTIVRINATRTLAHVARSGAPAHFETVIALLANPKTPTEIKQYLFQAAGALLGAIDPRDMSVRKHAADPKVIGVLVKTLQDCITKPEMILPDFKEETATEEDWRVIGFVRRSAVRALGQVKFATVPGPDGKTPLYPSYTLVRVAMSDPALKPAPSSAECAEAVIGLCHMAPQQWQGDHFAPVKNYNADVVVEAMLKGLITFAGPRAADQGNRTLPWRNYSLRIAEALTQWKPLFDPNFNFLDPNKFDASLVPGSVENLITFVIPKVLAPMEKVDAIDMPGLRALLVRTQENPKRKTTLFEGVKETSIDFPAPKPKVDPAPAPAPKK